MNGLGIPTRLSRSLAAATLIAALPSSDASAQDAPATGEYRRAVLAATGDAGRGRRLFEDVARTRCAGCHPVAGKGAALGPDFAGLGGERSEILDSILDPSAKIHPDYVSTVVALTSGRVLQGLVRPAGDAAVEIAVAADQAVRVARADIEEQAPSRVSLMPAGLHEGLAPGETADLLAFLASLAPARSASPREAVDPRDVPRAAVPVAFRPWGDASRPFQRPVWFGPLPGLPGGAVVIEMQRGRLWLLEDEGRRRSPFVDVGAETTPGELTGLTSVAFHPDFVHNRRYFLKLHSPRDGGRLTVRVIERKAALDGLRDSGEPSRPVIDIPVSGETHDGGYMAFGPDGFLYLGMGDDGPQNDPHGRGQDLSTLLGKFLRIDVDRAEGGRAYAVPPDNPFAGRPDARPEIWASGFREPWRFSFDPPSGDLWVGDVGEGQYEEVTIVRAGENHGWNVYEAFHPFSDRYARPDARYVAPVFAYHHRLGVSVTGGYVYRGAKNPALVGKYVFGDFETRRVWAIEQRDRALTSIVEIGRAPDRVVSFGLDSEGEIYVVGLDRGLIHRIDAASADLTPATPAREVLATSRREPVAWRRTEARPPAEWTREGFDDAAWAEAPGGFGSRGTPGAVVRTEWRSRELWLRRGFDLPAGDPSRLALSVHHDEDAEIYLNGVLAARLPGFVADYQEIPISDEARAALRPGGRNLLAVHCRQNGGGQYIDVGIVERPGRPTAAR
ncbi:PQQ-dependent sugar dehydrogenase [Paludisphaera mucosa]|uniref:PQQ-dependent sugar dehydrogenase n=1 Tax=Paludisphaera mucosa TaxID=3030827 RepID=A0ABT6FK42_9BACT|nr:PQQ-dependent sugar dehydrogenase [Paludisphaera mucosa]MDG3007941.1 PQQ-dependent sugar dehydrogenase [Paludisphaera mucosa]